MRYFKNTSWMFAEQALRMIAGLFVGIWVARYLGPEQFGIFSYAIAFVAIFAGIAKLGLDSIVVRELVNHPEKADVYLGTAFWLKVIGAVLAWVIIAITTLLSNNDHTTNIYILIIASGIIFQSFEVIDFYFQSQVLSKFVSACKISQLLLSSILKIYLVFTSASLLGFVLVSALDQMVLGVALYVAYKKQPLANFYNKFDWHLLVRLLKESWPIMLSGLAITIYMRIDQIMIQNMLGPKEVGIFTAAVSIVSAFYFIPMLITNSLFPSIISSKKISEEVYYKRVQLLFSILVWIAILIYIPMIFFSDWLVYLLYGTNFKDAGQILYIYAFAGLFVFMGVASGGWYINEGLQKISLYRTLIGALLNIAFNIILIPIYGLKGAAISTVIAQIAVSFLLDAVANKTRVVFIMKLKAILLEGIFDFKVGKLKI
jgi:O-antigen/teichoic acid export membrane protein